MKCLKLFKTYIYRHASVNLIAYTDCFFYMRYVNQYLRTETRAECENIDISELLNAKNNKLQRKNKGADQLCSNCTAEQRLCFRYTDSKSLFY